MGRLLNKVALITGAGTGIGRATARLCVAEGASVVLAGRVAARLVELESEILQQGGTAMAASADITNQDSVNRLVETSFHRFGHVDVLINNAGCAAPDTPVHQFSDAMWNEVLDVNLTGTLRMIRAVLPRFVSQRSGCIVNVASIAGLVGMRGTAAYCAAKAGVIALTRCVAVEYGPMGIRCNCICPGTVLTSLTQTALAEPERYAACLAGTAIGRLANPFEVAHGILYLSSDESSFVTGAVLPCDGGYTAH